MSDSLQDFKEAVREDVCTKCVCFSPDRGQKDVCAHEISGVCPIFEHLEKVVEIVRTVQSPEISPYIDALRKNVCCKCRNQDETGFCRMRDSESPVPTWCMLDAYLGLVVSSVERMLAK